MTIQGFTKRGDLIVDHSWVIDRDFGHFSHGYVVTSHASQGATVDKVFVAIASESVPATNQRSAYVAVTRGKEQAVIFTDDKAALLDAMIRPDDPMSATELAGRPGRPARRGPQMKPQAVAPRLVLFATKNDALRLAAWKAAASQQETDHA
jgi:hypothetical protein